MNLEELYQKIENEKVTDISRDLFYQICMKSHKTHDLLNARAGLQYILENEIKIPPEITVKEMKEINPRLYRIYLDVVYTCITNGECKI